MLPGRWAAPLPNPTASRIACLDGMSPSVPLVLDVLPGEVNIARLAADLSRAGRLPRWIRLAPCDLDRAALDRLAGTAVGRPGGPVPPLVVESADRRQAERWLRRLAAADRSGAAAPTLILRYGYAGRRRTPRSPPPGTGGTTHLDLATWDRPALREAVTGCRLPPGDLAAVVARSRGPTELTTRLAARLLAGAPADTVTLLDLAARLGYCHPRLRALEPVLANCPDQPWWTPLTGQWWFFEPAWQAAVRAAARGDPGRRVPLLGAVVRELVEQDAVDAAIELCLDADCSGTASDLIAGFGPDLLAAGRPQALRRWLDRLPCGAARRHRALADRVREACRAEPEAPARGRPRRRRRGPRDGTAPAAPPGVGPPAPRPDPDGPFTVRASLLGPYEVVIGHHRVGQWRGRKGPLLLAYLLLHRDRPVRRDVLAAQFWPDAAPDAARNRLHVALHTLRADLQTVTPVPVVLFDRGYTLNPDLDLRLDTEAFHDAVARARHAESVGEAADALVRYREAARWYGGELLAEYPYDGWTLLPREHYRLLMLDVLGRGARLAFETGRYAEAVEAGQRLLALDFCREELHRLLMRAYCRLGWPHLALRQFAVCAQHLRQELGIEPAPETVDLHGRVRARSPV